MSVAFTVYGQPAPADSSADAPSAIDRHRVMGLLTSVSASNEIRCVVVHGDPPSKARTRFTAKGRPYTPKKTVLGEKRIAAALANVGTFPGNVAVVALFYRASRQRIDVDNLLKAVLDAGTRANVWDDDSQVTALLGIVEHDREHPRCVIAFGHHSSSLTRGDDARVACEACGTLFFPAGVRRETARWCSRECGTVLATPIPCARCETPFKRRTGNQKYCGDACRTAALAETKRAATHCVNGHPYTPENTHRTRDGRRRCRQCSAAAQRRVRAAKVLIQEPRDA